MKKPTIANIVISLCLICIGFVPIILDRDATLLVFLLMFCIFAFFMK